MAAKRTTVDGFIRASGLEGVRTHNNRAQAAFWRLSWWIDYQAYHEHVTTDDCGLDVHNPKHPQMIEKEHEDTERVV